MRATVRVPATVANLGPGFDILALALQLQNEVHAESADGGGITVAVEGPDSGVSTEPGLLDPDTNLVALAYTRACDELGLDHGERGVALRCVNAIPMARGLGSSAAAALSGVLVAVALHRAPWDEARIIECAATFDGHPDNVAAALLGGLAICAPGAAVQRCDVPDELHALVYMPDAQLSTHAARAVVPTTLTRADAIFNAARCALLVRALMTRDYSALREAMDDAWHQRQRTGLLPATGTLIAAAYRGGADGACLAGAGPSVLALTARDPAPVAAALEAAAVAAGVTGRVLLLRARNFGARVEVRP